MAWHLAVLGTLPALAVLMAAACRGEIAGRLVAVQAATGLTALILILMSFAFDQQSYVDLALALAALGLPGTLVMALVLERWV